MKRILVMILLAGCVGVPLRTMVEVARLDPMTVDPAEIIIVVDTTPGVSLKAKGAQMIISSQKPDGETLTEVFLLPPRDPVEAKGLPHTDLTRRYFHLTQVDVDRVLKTRQTVALWKEEAPGTKGSLAVSARPCLETALSEQDPLLGQIWAKFRKDGPFVVIQPQKDFRSDLAENVELPACDDVIL